MKQGGQIYPACYVPPFGACLNVKNRFFELSLSILISLDFSLNLFLLICARHIPDLLTDSTNRHTPLTLFLYLSFTSPPPSPRLVKQTRARRQKQKAELFR